MQNGLLDHWRQHDFDAFEEAVLVARHRLAETGLFTDERLADLLDRHPAEDLGIATMGLDPQHFQWREGDRNGLSGREIIELVKRGHLWLNCRKLIRHHPEYAEAVHALLDEVQRGKPGWRAEDRTANLLISSPTAWVNYHVDMPVNALWHIRGTKRVWVYPHFDVRFAPGEVLEEVCLGRWSEDVPYDRSFDRYALAFDLKPGEVATWPQLAPHRVHNLDGLNVSLSTEHKNARARRRLNVHTANGILRGWGRPCRSIEADGLAAHAKQAFARACRYAGKLRGRSKVQYVYPKTFVLDPTSAHGYRDVDHAAMFDAAPHERLDVSAL